MSVDDGFVRRVVVTDLDKAVKQAIVVEVDMGTNEAFDHIVTDVYFDTSTNRFKEFGADGTDRDPQEWRTTRITIDGQHALATALLRIIQAAIRATAGR